MIARLRLLSGLVLFVYVTLHLSNHIAGLWSLSALDASRKILHLPWSNPVGVMILYASFVIHILLAFYAIYRRRRLRMRLGEAVQLLLGLALPPLLFSHVLGTRAADELYGTEVDYSLVLIGLWNYGAFPGIKQALVLMVAWVHGCLGMYYWMRLKPWYPRYQPFLFAGALLIPSLSLCGYLQATKDILILVQDPAWLAAKLAEARFPDAIAMAHLSGLQQGLFMLFFGLLAATLILRAFRLRWERRHGMVRLSYDNGLTIQFPSGRSILEASREAGIPHASICGGRGRCSTCRVRVIDGHERLPPASESELKVLAKVNASPQIRLACQTRPLSGDFTIIRILPANQVTARDGFTSPEYRQGQELNITVMFADLRAFTQLSETKLPYDVVFILNQYFTSMGGAIESAGGRIDKFIGDGIMALFGIGSDPNRGSYAALQAAYRMSRNLQALNRILEGDLETPLRIGIGIHSGPAIVGEMGYASAKSVTAIGDTVNTASRLEAKTKEYAAELIVSQAAVVQADLDLSGFDQEDITVRGREEPLRVRIVHEGSQLPLS